ncbi:exonuclease domain-containing protein [Kitasatospora herbaricolor]|uniref:3'-5' exonuclease n=1 Tax=Kitasatospora herbaricolor TaxID=68217 RepID=UPI0036DF74B8
MNPSTWPRLLVVDVEGNGATPPDLVEIAVVPIDGGLARPEQAKCTLVRPPHPITRFATGVHHITNQDVIGAPTWESIAEAVQQDLDGAWIAAHNASVEYTVLGRHLPAWKPAGVVDTLRLARAALPDAPKHGLDALITYTGLDTSNIPGKRHRAAYDAHVTALLLLELARGYATWDDLIKAAVPPQMPGAPGPDHEEQPLW